MQDSVVIVANLEEDQLDNNPTEAMADDCNDPRSNNERKTLGDCSTIHRIAPMEGTIGKRGDRPLMRQGAEVFWLVRVSILAKRN